MPTKHRNRGVNGVEKKRRILTPIGVKSHGPGSPRQALRHHNATRDIAGRTLGRNAIYDGLPCKRCTKRRMPRGSLFMQPLRGRSPSLHANPGCARPVVLAMMSLHGMAGRPWALLCNSFGVKICQFDSYGRVGDRGQPALLNFLPPGYTCPAVFTLGREAQGHAATSISRNDCRGKSRLGGSLGFARTAVHAPDANKSQPISKRRDLAKFSVQQRHFYLSGQRAMEWLQRATSPTVASSPAFCLICACPWRAIATSAKPAPPWLSRRRRAFTVTTARRPSPSKPC